MLNLFQHLVFSMYYIYDRSRNEFRMTIVGQPAARGFIPPLSALSGFAEENEAKR